METQTPKRPEHYPVTFMGIDRPSKAVRAMIAGLLAADERPTFTVEMATFGMYDGGHDMCYGCAATCTLMQLTGDERFVKTVKTDSAAKITHPGSRGTPGRYAEEVMGLNRARYFEDCIDLLRQGHYQNVVLFFFPDTDWNDMTGVIHPRIDLSMNTSSWKEQIPKAIALAELWESYGY